MLPNKDVTGWEQVSCHNQNVSDSIARSEDVVVRRNPCGVCIWSLFRGIPVGNPCACLRWSAASIR